MIFPGLSLQCGNIRTGAFRFLLAEFPLHITDLNICFAHSPQKITQRNGGQFDVRFQLTAVAMELIIHFLQQRHNKKHRHSTNNGRFIEANTQRKANTGRRPQTCRSGQTLDLIAAGDDDGACT